MSSRELTANRHRAGNRRTRVEQTHLLVLVVVLASVGCGHRDRGIASSGGVAANSSEKPETIDHSAVAFMRVSQPDRSVSADPVLYLAYAYGTRLDLPGNRLIGVMDGHATACREAGLSVCQLVASSREGDPAGTLHGSLTLRAEPEWLRRFVAIVESDAAGAAGRVTSQWTTTDDLTRMIVDTEATLRAKRALRDRLQQLLATRPGSLSDLLGVERELSRVQAEIDSTESNLVAARTRVTMSALTIEYRSSVRGVAGGKLEPLRLATGDFIVALVDSTVTLVSVVGALIPWIAAGTIGAWLLVRRRRRARHTTTP